MPLFFPQNRQLDLANLSEIHPIFYFLPPLWYPGFPFVEANSQVAAWKSNSCSINYEVFFLTEHDFNCGTGEDNRQEHRRYQENKRGGMIEES